jgi:cytochrome c oxidase subunit 4
MTAYLRGRLTVVWMLLVAVTFVSWWLGARGESGRLEVNLPITAGVVAIALVKTRLVFWHFMEVRTAPSWLRWNCDGWLVFLALMLFALYRYGL